MEEVGFEIGTEKMDRSLGGGRGVDDRPSHSVSATWLLTIIPQIVLRGTASSLLVILTGSPSVEGISHK